MYVCSNAAAGGRLRACVRACVRACAEVDWWEAQSILPPGYRTTAVP